MTARWDVDLDTERVHYDGSWLAREDLASRIQQQLASGDFKISRLSEALEFLAQTVAGARVVTVRLSGEQFGKLEGAGQKLNKPASAFARDLLLQVLNSGAPVSITPAPPPPSVIAAPPSVIAAPETEEPTLLMQPKRKDTHAPPPVVAAPAVVPEVVTEESAKVKSGQQPLPSGSPGEARRWFNRT